MEHTEGKIFENETIDMDGKSFSNCTFKKCTLIYGGGDFSIGEKVFLKECSYKFRGPAKATIYYLRFLGWIHPDKVQYLGPIQGSKPS